MSNISIYLYLFTYLCLSVHLCLFRTSVTGWIFLPVGIMGLTPEFYDKE